LEFGVPRCQVRGLGWRGHTCIKNLPRVVGEACAKFGGDWFGGSHMKEGHSVGILCI